MQTQLTKKQLARIDTCKTFRQMSRIAINSINNAIKKEKKPFIIELCAPISTGGKKDIPKNLAAMHKAIQLLKNLPYTLFNQLPYEDKIGSLKADRAKKRGIKIAYDVSILVDFYEEIFERDLVDMLVFMPNWRSSFGACWEHCKGQKNGIKTRQLKDNWVELITAGETNIYKLTFKI
jgi:hypothetical protein